jgi:two-component system response regulator NreC
MTDTDESRQGPQAKEPAGPIRILLADDHTVLRVGLRVLLNAEPDMVVVGEAGDGESAIQQVEALHPDVVVLDISMPGMNGLDALKHITAHFLDTRVLVLTMHAEKQYIVRVIEAGGWGYVLKSAADRDLVDAIRQVHRGQTYLYRDAVQVLFDHYRQQAAKADAPPNDLETLSEREREVLKLTAQGYSSREIGELLVISPKTVDTYRQRLMEKLGLHNRVGLVQYALQKGLLESEGRDPAE